MSGDSQPTGKKIGYRDIYVGLWKCRDFELSHFWQRSIFLTTFFILVFTGYGKLVECYFEKFDPSGAAKALGALQFHGIALALSCLGMVLSILWVCMAKGSKTWYERYENAINDFVDHFESNQNVFDSGVEEVAGFKYENLNDSIAKHDERERQRKRNRSLLRTGGADYSPSRINVFIGVFSFFLWIGLGLLHMVLLFRECPEDSPPRKLACIGLSFLYAGTIGLCFFLSLDLKHSPIASKWE